MSLPRLWTLDITVARFWPPQRSVPYLRFDSFRVDSGQDPSADSRMAAAYSIVPGSSFAALEKLSGILSFEMPPGNRIGGRGRSIIDAVGVQWCRRGA